MANPNKLEIIYQPAQKSIDFKLYKNDELLSDGSNYSKLTKYSREENKGKFVLQMQGQDFLDDILSPFSASINPVYIDFVTTEIESYDFEELVDDYNIKHNNRISLVKPASKVLPGMDACASFINEYGRAISLNLRDLCEKLINLDKKNKEIQRFVKEIEEQALSIDEKLNSFTNNVNICFVGITSTGKSTLINALLGFELLTMKDDPETSKVYEIKTPDISNKPYISFEYKNNPITISWNLDSLEISKPSKEISNFLKIESLKGSIQEQLKNIIIILNDKENKEFIGDKISVGIKIPFDSELVHYTLYDTPGTDSLDKKHQDILMDTLYSQTDTIVAFVINAKNMECSGNTILLQDIKNADGNSNKTKIDLDRSFFILNTADDAPELLEKYTKTIVDKKALENGDVFEVKLANKRLFFTSAKLALLSQKTDLTEDDEIDIASLRVKAKTDTRGKYYQHDRIGESRVGASRLRSNADKALEVAYENNNQKEIDYITSGLWSLREELSNYGNKYASAVKTAAISVVINSAIEIVNSKVNQLYLANNENIDSIKVELKKFEESTLRDIANITNKRTILDGKYFDEKISEKVGLSGIKTQEVENDINNLFIRIFGKASGVGIINNEKTKEFMKGFNSITRSYFEDINKNRMTYLINSKTEMLEEIKKLITADTNISEAIKKLIEGIKDPIIPSIQTTLKKAVDDIHSDENAFVKFFTNITSGKWHLESKKKLQESFISLWATEFENVRIKYRDDFIYANNELCADVKKKFEDKVHELKIEFSEYQNNLDLYGSVGEFLKKSLDEILLKKEQLQVKILAK